MSAASALLSADMAALRFTTRPPIEVINEMPGVPQRVELTSALIRPAYGRGGPARGGCPLSTPGRTPSRALLGRVRVGALAGVAGAGRGGEQALQFA
jgi:hypothetical protein